VFRVGAVAASHTDGVDERKYGGGSDWPREIEIPG
jgi:hypothetical protein